MSIFKLKTDFKPKGHQKKAIRILSKGVNESEKHQVLLGVTGSGKTFTMANVIAETGKPTIIMAPNKTLAAQLYNEFQQLFPENAVEYFVSYYDYYQPEAYIPTSDTYIQKDSSINEMIDKMRHSATRNLLSRKDVIIIASVSCIYGLGAPEDYLALRIEIETGMEISRDKLLKELVGIQYERNDMDFHRGTFRVRGDVVEVFPAYEEEKGIRLEFFGDEIDSLSEFDPLTGKTLRSIKHVTIFPGSHYVTLQNTRKRAVSTITEELKTRIDYFRNENKLLEAQRIDERTNYDLEMIREIGYCNGIENYSRHLTGRNPGESPPTLFDYLPDDFLMFFDESHVSVSQLRAMYRGDRSRKSTLVEFGFRLPSALDNRPLKFEEYVEKVNQVIYVSATPADYELEICNGNIVEQIVRPTGLIDPEIIVKPAKNQVDDLYDEIVKRQKRSERILVTCLTKNMSEDLAEYYTDLGLPVRYLHSEIKTMERMEIINDLREGLFDVLIGINLLREGLDIPEVSLVAILDADKEGFLRSNRSLIQTCGRAARNSKGQVIMYADKITKSMQYTIDETDRRKKIQIAYNKKHNITPETISKNITSAFDKYDANKQKVARNRISEKIEDYATIDNIEDLIESLEKEMKHAAKALEFETAAKLRDKIRDIKKKKK